MTQEQIKDEISLRQRIISKARYIISKKGFSGLKIDDLARELGISKRTLYENFSSKKELFNTVINDVLSLHRKNIQEVIDRLEDEDNSDFMSDMSKLIVIHSRLAKTITKEFLHDAERYVPEIFEKLKRYRYEKMQENFYRISSIGRKKGFFKDYNDKLVFFLNLALLDYVLSPEILSELPLSLEETLDTVNEIMMTGLLSDKGREEYHRNILQLTES